MINEGYWSGTAYTHDPDYTAWNFDMYTGEQRIGLQSSDLYGLAVRSGQVSLAPEPTTMLLFGVGLLGIAGVNRRRNQ